MKRIAALIAVALVLFTQGAWAKPKPVEKAPAMEYEAELLQDKAAPAAAAVDTFYLLGGPGSWDGSFENAGGGPDWHGWTSEDASGTFENHWHVSDYMAHALPGKGDGNHAMYCGDETIASCDPPDSIGGYGQSWNEEIEWRHAVADTNQSVNVRVTGLLRWDTESGYDFLRLGFNQGDTFVTLATWDALGTETLDYSVVIEPGDYTGPSRDEIRLAWQFQSDSAWDDSDCNAPTQGACQIDDLAVEVDEVQVTFDDFEPGSSVSWHPYLYPGVGDFASLRNNLPSVHPCQSINMSYQANFIDDGVVVPGTGGTPCIEWCYGPGGWIVNNDGGLMSDFEPEIHLINRILSPALPWPTGMDAAEVAFDVYQHHMFENSASGANAIWLIRSTSSPDPADLADAPWQSIYGHWDSSHGQYYRLEFPVGHLVVQDRRWVQISLGTREWQFVHGIKGPNGTPAPYFDNVAFKVWDPEGPDITVAKGEMFGDTFPENGILDPLDLVANWCRLDMMKDPRSLNTVRGDSLVADITPLRQGAVVASPPTLHWVMACNPVFDSVRPQAPDFQGILRGSTAGFQGLNQYGNTVEGKWAFDLPDTGFFFPGDRLRCYVIAEDDLGGDVRMAVWPSDTTGILDFSAASPFTYLAEVRALPSVELNDPGAFSHPPMLFVDDSYSYPQPREAWLTALEDLGFQEGLDFEVMTVFGRTTASILTLDILDGYRSLIHSGGNWPGYGLTPDSDDVVAWLNTEGKSALFAGANLARYFNADLRARIGIDYLHYLLPEENGDYWELQLTPAPANDVLPPDTIWEVDAACPKIVWLNAVDDDLDLGRRSAALDPLGSPVGTFAGLVTTIDDGSGTRTAFLPFDLNVVTGMDAGSAKRAESWSPATYLAAHILDWLGEDVVTAVDDVPGARAVTVSAHPNPFNPATTISFALPRAGTVTLEIFDIQGRKVRTLIDDQRFEAGRHEQPWDGRDQGGRGTSSGVYFYRFATGSDERVGKLTLLK